jgi:hypothetical protein
MDPGDTVKIVAHGFKEVTPPRTIPARIEYEAL